MSVTLDASTSRFDDLPESTWPRLEAVDGGVLMTPAATFWHQRMVARLMDALRPHVPAGYEVLGGTNVSPNEGRDGLIPDVVVQREAEGLYVHPRDVLLVVEVESPSTRRVDRLVKPSIYASWDIPAYWRVTCSDIVTQVLRGDSYVEEIGGWLAEGDLSGLVQQ